MQLAKKEVGAFVLMKTEFLHTIKHYVGIVTELLDNEDVTVKYLCFKEKEISFYFPTRDEKDKVPETPLDDDIMYVPPICRHYTIIAGTPPSACL